jgi:RimJ/RimL family protein N-acetyltransferase
LTLRGYRRDDFPDAAAMWGDPAVTHFVLKTPLTPEETWSRFLRDVGHWAVLGYGCWVVRERGSGRFVGEVGIFDRHRALAGAHAARFTSAPEAGWVLAHWCHGRGYATEAMAAVLAWADATGPGLGAPRTVCMIDEQNAASMAVAHKLGFAPLGPAEYAGKPVLVLERPAAARR